MCAKVCNGKILAFSMFQHIAVKSIRSPDKIEQSKPLKKLILCKLDLLWLRQSRRALSHRHHVHRSSGTTPLGLKSGACCQCSREPECDGTKFPVPAWESKRTMSVYSGRQTCRHLRACVRSVSASMLMVVNLYQGLQANGLLVTEP